VEKIVSRRDRGGDVRLGEARSLSGKKRRRRTKAAAAAVEERAARDGAADRALRAIAREILHPSSSSS
jgi:hypothetical protein